MEIHLRIISQEILTNLIFHMCSEITLLTYYWMPYRHYYIGCYFWGHIWWRITFWGDSGGEPWQETSSASFFYGRDWAPQPHNFNWCNAFVYASISAMRQLNTFEISECVSNSIQRNISFAIIYLYPYLSSHWSIKSVPGISVIDYVSVMKCCNRDPGTNRSG